VFSKAIQFKIGMYVAILILLAMFLVDIVMLISSEKALLRSEINRGRAFISTLEMIFEDQLSRAIFENRHDSMRKLDQLLDSTDYSCVQMVDAVGNTIVSRRCSDIVADGSLALAREALAAGTESINFFGSTWGVLWKQGQNLVISAPLMDGLETVVGVSLSQPLDDLYQAERETQKVVLIYMAVNAIILSLVGVFLLFRLTVRPIQRLVKRSEAYRQESELFFLNGREDNLFGRLSKSLNMMLARISEDREQLKTNLFSLKKANADLKRAQADIVRAEKLAATGRLSAGIAHEIGNPLGIVMGYLELLRDCDRGTEEHTEFLNRTEKEIGRINAIIGQLLELSRPSRSGTKIVSVHAIIEEIVALLQLQPLMANVLLKRNLYAEFDGVKADPEQLHQVFLNLIINAADAISMMANPGGKVIGKTFKR